MTSGIVFAVVPLAFNRIEALQFTRWSEKLFGELERNGSITGKRLGRNGEVIYLREQLEAVYKRLHGLGLTDIDEEFEGIGG